MDKQRSANKKNRENRYQEIKRCEKEEWAKIAQRRNRQEEGNLLLDRTMYKDE